MGRSERPTGSIAVTILITVLVAGTFAVAIYPLPRLLLASDGELWMTLNLLARYQLEGALRTALVQSVAGTLVVLGAVTALRQYNLARWQAQSERNARFVDAFTKAVEQLESDRVSTATAGVYALERLGRNSPEDGERISEVLAAFVRSEDSTSAVKATAIRALSQGQKAPGVIDLSGAYLYRVRLSDLDLSRFVFDGCDLRESKFLRCQLTGASFVDAQLARATMDGQEAVALTSSAQGA